MATATEFVTGDANTVIELTGDVGVDFFNAGQQQVLTGDFESMSDAVEGLKENGVGIPCPSGHVIRTDPGSGEKVYAISSEPIKLSKHA